MKRRALVVIAVTFGVSLVLVDNPVGRLSLGVVAAILVIFLLRLPTRR